MRAEARIETERPPDSYRSVPESWFASSDEVEGRDRFMAFFLGFPLELSTRVSRWPPATTTILWLCVVVTVLGLGSPPLGDAFALSTQRITFFTPMQMVTSIFLHGDLWHLAGNLYFLVAFARLPETWIGSARLTALFLFAEIVSSLIFLLAHYGENSSVVGASGGISAILAVYMVLFPTHRVGLSLLVVVVRIPAFLYIGFWIYLQLLLLESEGEVGVAYSSHLAGIAVGLGWGLYERRRLRAE